MQSYLDIVNYETNNTIISEGSQYSGFNHMFALNSLPININSHPVLTIHTDNLNVSVIRLITIAREHGATFNSDKSLSFNLTSIKSASSIVEAIAEKLL